MVLRIRSVVAIAAIVLLPNCMFEEKEEFFCDKNALVYRGGDKICASARVDKHTKTETNEYIKVDVSWTGNNLQLTINTTEIKTGETYTDSNGASFWFGEINQRFSTAITITHFDRDNMTISGEFDVTGEGAYNYQAYDYAASGSFTDVVIY